MEMFFDIPPRVTTEIKEDCCVHVSNDDLSPSNKPVLEALLKAIGFSDFDSVISVYKKGQAISLSNVPRVVLFVDKSDKDRLHLDLPYYTISTTETGLLLLSDTITDLQLDKNKKIALWGELQKMFLK